MKLLRGRDREEKKNRGEIERIHWFFSDRHPPSTPRLLFSYLSSYSLFPPWFFSVFFNPQASCCCSILKGNLTSLINRSNYKGREIEKRKKGASMTTKPSFRSPPQLNPSSAFSTREIERRKKGALTTRWSSIRSPQQLIPSSALSMSLLASSDHLVITYFTSPFCNSKSSCRYPNCDFDLGHLNLHILSLSKRADLDQNKPNPNFKLGWES